MDSYDNDWVLMLDDDLFIVEEKEADRCSKNTILTQQAERSETVPSVQLQKPSI